MTGVKGEEMSRFDVVTVALDTVAAAIEAPTKTDAIFDARALLADMDEAALRRVAGCLAVELVWRKNADRQALLRWVDTYRLQLAWESPKSSEVVDR